MADTSLSLQRGFQDAVDTGATVTAATSSPGAGDIEVRISGTAGWNTREIYAALEQFMRYLHDANYSTFPQV